MARTGGPYGIPHKFRLFGEVWTVTWVARMFDPEDSELDKDELWGEVVYGERLIRLSKRMLTFVDKRTNEQADPSLVWEAFIHEVMHAIDMRWPKVRGKVTRHALKRRRWTLSHATMFRLDEPLGILFWDSKVVFPCICRRCNAA